MVFQYLVFFVFSWSQLCPSNCFCFQVTPPWGGAATHGRDLGSKQPSGCPGVPCECQPLTSCPILPWTRAPLQAMGVGGCWQVGTTLD